MRRSEDLRDRADAAAEAVRSAALGAAPDGIRAFVIPAAARDAVRGALEEDGLAVAFASDATTLVGRATDTLALGGVGPMALARAARNALANGTVRALFLDEAGAADPVTAKFWWTLAVLLSDESAPDGVLIAACKPRVRAPWTEARDAVRGLIPVRELVSPAASEAVRPKTRTPRGGPTRARRALLRATAALLRGAPRALEEAAARSIAASEATDDPREGAAGALAGALRGFPEDRVDPLNRALALARLANDDVLAASAEIAAATSAWLRGDLGAARERFAHARLARLPRSLSRALVDLAAPIPPPPADGGTPDGSEPEPPPDCATLATRGDAHERAGRRAVAARLFACAAAAQGQPFRGATWERARKHWDASDPRLSAAVSAAASPGLGSATLPPGAAGIAEALRAAATLAVAGSPGAALELACQLVPCRSALLLDGENVLAARGAAALALGRLHADGAGRGSAPSELTAGTKVRVVLARSADDPPFSRDERRLAGAAVELAISVLSPAARTRAAAATGSPAPSKRKRPGRVQALDDRLSLVERDAIVDALRKNGGNLSRTARTLGLSRNGLKMKLARHGLPRGTAA